MAISKHILDLVTLALQDRVLTYKERQAILQEAKNTGSNVKDTEEYIDKALRKRLKSFSKEELIHCPSCGALVPLISDDCLFCGTHLYKGDTNKVINVSGWAADIIRKENRKTEIKQQNITQCQCGAPFPLVSNICSYCGRVLHKRLDSDQNIKNLIANINQSIDKLKQTLRPSFGLIIECRSHVIIFYLVAALYVVFGLFGYELMWAISCFIIPPVFLFMIFGIYQGAKENIISPVEKADMEYYDALHSYEKYQRQVATIYGENPEAKTLLATYAKEINGYKQARVKSRKKIAALMVSVMIIPVIIWALTPPPSKKYMAELDDNPIINEMRLFSKAISPMPDSTVHKNYSDFLTVEGDTRLMFDALYQYHTELDDNDITYQLRIDPVKIISTGKKNEQSDTCSLSIGLTDKDGHLVGKDLMPISVLNSKGKDYRAILENEQGCIYAEFTSRTASTQRLKEVADSAYYFIIF